jgi:hypothetical protein
MMYDTCAWVATCLDVDVVAQGTDEADALNGFSGVWLAQSTVDLRAGYAPFSQIAAAPQRYHERFDALPIGYPWTCDERVADSETGERTFEVRVAPRT